MSNIIQLTPYFSTIKDLRSKKEDLQLWKLKSTIDESDDNLVGYLKCLNEVNFLTEEANDLRRKFATA